MCYIQFISSSETRVLCSMDLELPVREPPHNSPLWYLDHIAITQVTLRALIILIASL